MAEPRRLSLLSDQVTAVTDLPPGGLVIALSGGADSAALLWISTRLERDVRAVHVHHGLAGSDRMAAAAADVAAATGSKLSVSRVEVPSGPSPESQARLVRYQALEAKTQADEWILTAHTADDQAETVLDHLLRASGLDGLRGIPRRRGRVWRPFLAVRRAQTRELATLAGLAWVDDPANLDPSPLRNRIRTGLIPHLEAGYNPRLRESLVTTAALVESDLDHLDSLAAAPSVDFRHGAHEMAASTVSTAPAVLAGRLVRRILAAAGLAAASRTAVTSVIEVARGDRPRCQPGAGLEVRRRGAMLVVERATPTPPDSVSLTAPGTTSFGSWVVDVRLHTAPPPAMPLGAGWMAGDADVLGLLRIEAAAGHPEIAHHLAATGIAGPDRPSYPVVVGGRGVVWVPGVRRFPIGWVDDTTDRYLVARIRPA